MVRLTAKQIEAGKALKRGLNGDGNGLYLNVKASGARSWIYRYQISGRRHDMGLGGYPAVSLSEAREKSRDAAVLVRKQIDPRSAKRKPNSGAKLSDLAADCLEARRPSLKNERSVEKWFAPVKNHILPRLGHLPISEIDQHTIRDCLSPIWRTQPDTAAKALGRLVMVLRHAKAEGLEISGGNVTELKADTLTLLGKQHVTTNHIPSMPWQDVSAFYQSLTTDHGTGALALRLLILTGLRSQPVRFARLEEIDVVERIWTVPAESMKGRKGKTTNFRVPLTSEAIAVITEAANRARDGYLFPGAGRKLPVISDMTMNKIMRDRDLQFRPHGFRSSLREWIIAEQPQAPWHVGETVLQHTVRTSVEQAYARTDFLDQRRPIMDAWAAFLTGKTDDMAIRRAELLAELKALDDV